MSLTKLLPWSRKNLPIRREDNINDVPALWSDFDQMFNRFLGFSDSHMSALNSLESRFCPNLDMHETDKEFQISLEVPGMEEKDIDISMSRDMLTISGEKKEERRENAQGVYRTERRYGAFTRHIPLAQNCFDTEKVQASFKNGVVTITLPKTAHYKESVKKIPVVSSRPAVQSKGGNN